MNTRPPKVLVVHPGASWSTADVYAGLMYGLTFHGVEAIEYRLDNRIGHEHRALKTLYQRAKRLHRDAPQPTKHDVLYRASLDMIPVALKRKVDAVIVVSAMFAHPDVIIMLRRANTKVIVLCTETPYDLREELRIAELLTQPDDFAGCIVNPPSGVWTNERSSVPQFLAVNPWSSYLPHAWHPKRHGARPLAGDVEAPSHDVVFVGTGFSERVQLLEAIDWTGIDLGLYGTWELGRKSPLQPFVRAKQIPNTMSAALYRRAKINLNLYRQSVGWAPNARRIDHAESLNPRAYELSACGAFHLSDPRAEVAEKFADLVPTFTTAVEAEALIRHWLADDAGRAAVAAQLPACVAEDSWVHRARQVMGDLYMLLQPKVAA